MRGTANRGEEEEKGCSVPGKLPRTRLLGGHSGGGNCTSNKTRTRVCLVCQLGNVEDGDRRESHRQSPLERVLAGEDAGEEGGAGWGGTVTGCLTMGPRVGDWKG